MTFALKELTRLIAPQESVVGVVVGVDGSVVRVATERGAVTARSLEALTVGMRIQIKNGIATRLPVAKQIFPV